MAREYKDSGIEWIGRIPKDWKVCSLSQMAKEHYISNKNIHNQNLLSLSYGKIVNKNINTTDGLLPASFDTYQIVEDGNIVLRLTDLQNDQRSLRVGLSTQKGIITSAYLALEAMSLVLPKYLHYQLHSADIKKVFYSMGNGVRQNLNWVELRKLNCILPSLDEQQAIASYLDKKCAEIDSLVELQEQMIAQLTDYKQSVITEAVTKGLNPEAELVPSGIDWIGDVPKGWAITKVKWQLNERKERSERGKEEPLSMSQKYGLIPTKEMDVVPNMASSFVGAKLVYKGDLVFNKLKAHLGVFAVSKFDGLVSPDYAVYSKRGNCSMKYLEYLFKTPQYIAEFRKLSTGVGAGLTRLYTDDLFSISCIYPPANEQESIALYIQEKCHEIDTLISIKRQKIETLKEYKKSIIFEAVTGKTNID
ncbi:MAG TPA: restriction endonuclease subunit S [Candidatus Bacteroides pullicola]|uniref:Restriction endonuclease subunit S n=1 Tax=Candidatus Bacteroides pullicola TaxID=2838475 RepID=A0A9D1ZGG9_9BACE|nr:restriction endonuclease subunit S [Candidatus Bacteroides pullicola]